MPRRERLQMQETSLFRDGILFSNHARRDERNTVLGDCVEK